MEHKKLLVLLIMGIFLLSLASAAKWDNVKNFDEKIGKYGKYEIRNSILGIPFLQLDKVMEIELKSNTDSCGINCEATQDFILYEDGALVDDITFFTIKDDGKSIKQKIRSYNLYYHNGTDWKEFQLGQEFSGNDEGELYNVKLTGEKKPSRTVDWIYETGGIQLNDWAIWGNISEGDDAEVILNSPEDNYVSLTYEVEFNCSANVTGGAIIENASLWTNETGSWVIGNTTIPGSYLEEAHGTALPNTFGPDTTRYGMRIFTGTETLAVNNITKDSNVAAGRGFILNSGRSIIATGTFVGDTADMGGYVLSASTQYYFALDDNGASYTIYRSSSGMSGVYPIVDTYLNWTGGLENNIDAPDYADAIKSANVRTVTSTVTETWTRTLSEETIWNCQACDSDDDCGFAEENRTVLIDETPPSITINTPTTINFGAVGQNETLNYTVTDANLDSCWYDYNGTNYTAPCTSGMDNVTYFLLENANTNLTFYANDTIGNENSTFFSWDYKIFESERIFNAETLQTATEQFKFVGSKSGDIISTSGTFWYNGTEYLTLAETSGNSFNLTSSLTIPADLEGNITFFWEITYTNSTGSYSLNTTTSTQEVFELLMTECFEPAIDGLTLNFTTYDSTNLTALNSTLEATFQFYPEEGSGSIIVEYLFSDLNENRSNYLYCLESSGENVTLDAFISYGATDYDNREYIIDDGLIGNFTQDIPLYLTLTEITDIVTITVQDQNYDPITGALVAIQKWNIGTNTYSTIGMFTTSSTGQGILDLELYSTWYRAVVNYNGAIEEVTDVQKLSSTSWIITVDVGVDNPYDLFGDISHGLTFDNETNITSFTWLDSSGYTQEGCLVVKNQTSLGQITIEDECVESVSGTVDYLIVGDGSYTAYGIIFLDGYNQSQIVRVLNIQLGIPEITEKVSPFGKVISFLVVGTMGLIGVSAGSAFLGGFLIIAALVALLYFGFLNITAGFIWGIVSILILVWVLQRRKR